jgi:hypothetical protein
MCTVFGNAAIVKLLFPPLLLFPSVPRPDAPPPMAIALTAVTPAGTTQLYVPGIVYAILELAAYVVVDRLPLFELLPYEFVAYIENE